MGPIIEGRYDLAEMRAKWERYKVQLEAPEGNGSMLGRSFIIAKSGVSDMLTLLDLLEGALEAADE